jgi:hypothetical protein
VIGTQIPSKTSPPSPQQYPPQSWDPKVLERWRRGSDARHFRVKSHFLPWAVSTLHKSSKLLPPILSLIRKAFQIPAVLHSMRLVTDAARIRRMLTTLAWRPPTNGRFRVLNANSAPLWNRSNRSIGSFVKFHICWKTNKGVHTAKIHANAGDCRQRRRIHRNARNTSRKRTIRSLGAVRRILSNSVRGYERSNVLTTKVFRIWWRVVARESFVVSDDFGEVGAQ